MTLSLNQQNTAVLMLNQALQGAISPNFRRIAISFLEDVWKIEVFLEVDDAIDRDEIEEVVDQFIVYLYDVEPSSPKIETLVQIGNSPLKLLEKQTERVVFQRRE